MNEATPETYILSIPGTEQTEELSRGAVLERMARGEITPEHWVWSAPDNDWKQVSEIPSLRAALPATSRPGAPAPGGTSFLNQLGMKKTTPITTAAAPLPATRKMKRKVVRHRRDERDDGFPFFSFIAGLLILALIAVVGLNYELIDKPFDGNLARSPFVLVQAHAHLGAFVQPDTLVIHVLPSSELKRDNFADFLFTLAQGTPPPPFGWKPFAAVELTPRWRGLYAFTGDDWRGLAQMSTNTSEERRDFILNHLDDSTGRSLAPGKGLAPDEAKLMRDRVWGELLGSFQVTGG